MINYEMLNIGSTQPLITQTALKNTEVIIPQKKF
jgi:restriction endonuclease S subunit